MGTDVFHMTLVNQQVVPLGESMSLGVVDADKSRVLFFVDAPLSTSVTAVGQEEPDPRTDLEPDSASVHAPGHRAAGGAARENGLGVGSRKGQPTSDGSGGGPDLLPFPSKSTRQASTVNRPHAGLASHIFFHLRGLLNGHW